MKFTFRTPTTAFFIGAAVATFIAGCQAQTSTLQEASKAEQTAKNIREEAIRPNGDQVGYPLPLLSSWNTGGYKPANADATYQNITPGVQIDLIEQGHHILPAFGFPNISSDAGGDKGAGESAIERQRATYEPALKRAAALRLPLTLVSTEWERLLSDDPKYSRLPPEKNPNVVTPEGKIINKVSPFGPVEYWREVGRRWGSSPLMKQVQQWYPNPPAVVLLSNNEHRVLRWKDAEEDARYLERYGKGRDADFKRQVIADGWIERYHALQEGMREALIAPTWREKSVFVGYNAFGAWFYGRWGGWQEYTLDTKDRIDPNPLYWDGGSPSYYTDDWNDGTDFRVWSPQIESMNWVFMQREALRLNPRFWFEFSIWDGQEFNEERSKQFKPKAEYYRSLGQQYGPERYAAFAQYGLWLLRPRVIREYRGWKSDPASRKPYYLALASVVDRVYANETLRQFWRRGELVSNRAHQHPYQSAIPEKFREEQRWFLLDTNLDAPRPWKLETEVPVFSLALVLGKQGNRQWLVYAHSPLQERRDVEITIPDYKKIKVDVPVSGAFYIVDEKAATTRLLP